MTQFSLQIQSHPKFYPYFLDEVEKLDEIIKYIKQSSNTRKTQIQSTKDSGSTPYLYLMQYENGLMLLLENQTAQDYKIKFNIKMINFMVSEVSKHKKEKLGKLDEVLLK